MKQAYFFDLYGTLIDIHTDEKQPALWKFAADYLTAHGAPYRPKELQDAYLAALSADIERVRRQWKERGVCVQWPEPDIGNVFQGLYKAKGAWPGAGGDAAPGNGPDTALSNGPDAAPGNGPDTAPGTDLDTAHCAGPGDSLIRETAWAFRRKATCHLRLYAGAKELLQELRRAGRQVYVLSNAQSLYTLPELRLLGIDDLFDGIYISSDCGAKKPDPVFYRRPLVDLGLDAKDCLMIGNDYQCDILGAAGVGMDGYYILSGLSPKERRETFDEDIKDAAMFQRGMDLDRVRRKCLSEAIASDAAEGDPQWHVKNNGETLQLCRKAGRI